MGRTTITKAPLIGYVTNVDINREFSEIRVNVIVGNDRELTDIQVYHPHRYSVNIPQVGDYIEVRYLEGKYIAQSVSTRPEHIMPRSDMADICISQDQLTWLHFVNEWTNDGETRNDVDINMAASGDMKLGLMAQTEGTIEDASDFNPEENTWLKMERTGTESSDPVNVDSSISGGLAVHLPDEVDSDTTGKEMGGEKITDANSWVKFERRDNGSKVDVDMAASGNMRVHFPDSVNNDETVATENSYFEFVRQGDGTVDLNINVSGDVNISQAQNIYVGDNGNPVAIQGHTHDYDDDGTTKTTGKPNESGTNTVIE